MCENGSELAQGPYQKSMEILNQWKGQYTTQKHAQKFGSPSVDVGPLTKAIHCLFLYLLVFVTNLNCNLSIIKGFWQYFRPLKLWLVRYKLESGLANVR